MKIIIVPILLLLLLNPILSTQKSDNPTLVFFVKHADQPLNDFIEISLKIQSKDQSLTSAIKKGASSVEEISNYAKDFCQENAKKKGECKQIIDADVFQIEPRYQLIRKQPAFMGFTVKNEMTIAVTSADKIGHLVDKILSKQGVILSDFKWKSSKENKVNEQAIALGMQEGQGLCEQLGLKLGRVISVVEVHASQAAASQQNDEQEEDKDQQSEDGENLTVFKFQVECAPKTTKTSAKKQ